MFTVLTVTAGYHFLSNLSESKTSPFRAGIQTRLIGNDQIAKKRVDIRSEKYLVDRHFQRHRLVACLSPTGKGIKARYEISPCETRTINFFMIKPLSHGCRKGCAKGFDKGERTLSKTRNRNGWDCNTHRRGVAVSERQEYLNWKSRVGACSYRRTE